MANTNSSRRHQPSAASAVSSQLDRPYILAFMALLVIYTGVTLLTYEKLSRADSRPSNTEVPVSKDEARAAEAPESRQRSVVLNQRDKKPEKTAEYLQHHSFPVHVTKDDSEWIMHPGLQWTNRTAIDLSGAPLDIPRNILVPKFWSEAYSEYYNEPESVRNFLGDNGKRVMTPEEAAMIGSYTQPDGDGGGMRETIYCSVASYRDYECTPTVVDLFERAEYPERIRVAVIDQSVSGTDEPCLTPKTPCSEDPEQVLCKYRHLMDYYHLDARLAVGPVFARHLAHRLYRGEYYAMQVDSHVRFTHNWDTDIVGQWKSAKNEYAVLTAYLSDIHGRIDPVTHLGTRPDRPIMCKSDFEGGTDYKHLRHGQQPEGMAGIHGQPTLEPYWAAGYSFARGHFVVQVPYDQYLPMVFQGEEISIGLRGFTYGYDYYAPETGVCFHIYAVQDNAKRRHKVPMFWENTRTYKGVGEASMKRLNSIIGMVKAPFPPNEWPQQEKEKYGLGSVRTTKKFFKTFGIHIKRQRIEHNLCKFVGRPMMKEFMPFLRSNRMGLDYDKINYRFKDVWSTEEEKKNKYHDTGNQVDDDEV